MCLKKKDSASPIPKELISARQTASGQPNNAPVNKVPQENPPVVDKEKDEDTLRDVPMELPTHDVERSKGFNQKWIDDTREQQKPN